MSSALLFMSFKYIWGGYRMYLCNTRYPHRPPPTGQRGEARRRRLEIEREIEREERSLPRELSIVEGRVFIVSGAKEQRKYENASLEHRPLTGQLHRLQI